MKLSKTLLASLLATAAVATASAQTKIYVTGSTAFRSAAVSAITSVVGVAPSAYDGATSGVTSANNANAATWTGGTVGGQAVTIKASFSGSAGGIQTVAGSLNVRFLVDGANTTAADPRNTANPAEVAVPNVAFSDAFQGSTPFNRTFAGVTYNTLADTQVGVVTFKWVASNGFPGTNVNNIQLQQLFSAGFAPLALFTGNATGNGTVRTGDQLQVVYATGRDFDSGTRLSAFADSGVGALATVVQYKPTVSGNTITALAKYPITTINGVSTGSLGNGGESSGSSLRGFTNKVLTASAYQTEDGSANGGFLLTYLGVSDATTVLPGGSGAGAAPAVELSFNGVPFSTNAVQQGSYSFWGYEHVLYRSTQGGIQKTFGDNLSNQILSLSTASLSPNVAISDMAVQRGGDGSPISPVYL
ncbi:MAG: hypothetical protein ACR2HH_05030 [Chthoniobacterales bacterium]